MSYLPAIMSIVGAASSIAGTVTSAIGAQREGQATSAAAEANARLMGLQAEGIERAGAYDEARLRREKGQMISRQRALYAKSGIRITEGSPLEVQADTASQYEMDIAANRFNIDIQKEQSLYQGKIYRMTGQSALRASRAKSTSILLSGFGQVGTGFLSNYGGRTLPAAKSKAY